MIRRPPRSTLSSSSAASDVYKRQSDFSPESRNLATSRDTLKDLPRRRSSTELPNSSADETRTSPMKHRSPHSSSGKNELFCRPLIPDRRLSSDYIPPRRMETQSPPAPLSDFATRRCSSTQPCEKRSIPAQRCEKPLKESLDEKSSRTEATLAKLGLPCEVC